jgi:hypothetical protein
MKLQIVIPTLRGPYLQQTLDSIPSEYLLLVDDPVVGFDEAYINAISKASADYVWLFADDDLIISQSIPAILKAIESNPHLIVANSCVMDNSMTKTLKSPWLTMSTFQLCGEASFAFSKLGDLMSYVGSIIIRRDLWINGPLKKYIGTRFITFGVPCEVGLDNVIFISDICSKLRYGHQSWIPTAKALNDVYNRIVWDLPFEDWAKSIVSPKNSPLWQLLSWKASNNLTWNILMLMLLRIFGKQNTITCETLRLANARLLDNASKSI